VGGASAIDVGCPIGGDGKDTTDIVDALVRQMTRLPELAGKTLDAIEAPSLAT